MRFRSVIPYIGWYIGIVLVSAVVNWVVFKFDTTSFVISEQLNKHMVRYDLLSNDLNFSEFHANAKDLMPVSLDGFAGAVASKLMRLSNINDSLSVYERQLEWLKGQLDSVRRVAESNRTLVAEDYRTKALKDAKQRLDSLRQLMAVMDSTVFIEKGLLIEEAHLELDYAIENKRVTDYISENMRNMIPPGDRDLMDEYSSKIVACSVRKSSLEYERNDIARTFREDVNQFHRNRSSSVNLLDFLYYSVCVSTTVSFGDIAPNNGLTRFLAVLELLSCIVLVSFILKGIGGPGRNKGAL